MILFSTPPCFTLVTFFRRTYAVSVVVKMKSLRKSVFSCVKAKTISNFAVRLANLMNQIFQTCVLLIM